MSQNGHEGSSRGWVAKRDWWYLRREILKLTDGVKVLKMAEHPRLALDGVAPHLVLGHLRILRVRLLSIVYYKKSSAASGNTKRTPPRTRRGQLAGTRYTRQANRGTGLGRGDPSAFDASGLQ